MEVRFLDVRTVPLETLARWEQWLDGEKRQRIDRLRADKRLLSLCGDGLAREMLAQTLGCTPAEIRFTYSETGKPLTDGAFFSVSHSGDLVACAVSNREIGLDLEKIRPVPARLARALDCEEAAEDFWRRWTRLEAALKCRGETLGTWKRSREEGLCFLAADAPEGYVVSVCEKE